MKNFVAKGISTISISIIALLLMVVGAQADGKKAEAEIPTIELEYMTQIQVAGPNLADLEPFSYTGRHLIGRILGGTAKGPVLNGEIMPVGEDWALLKPDGTLEVDVRTLLRTDDGALIHVYWEGLWHGSKQVMDRILAGQDVSPEEYYLRVTPRFETQSEKYYWLNNVIAIGYGKVNRGAGAIISIFRVK